MITCNMYLMWEEISHNLWKKKGSTKRTDLNNVKKIRRNYF